MTFSREQTRRRRPPAQPRPLHALPPLPLLLRPRLLLLLLFRPLQPPLSRTQLPSKNIRTFANPRNDHPNMYPSTIMTKRPSKECISKECTRKECISKARGVSGVRLGKAVVTITIPVG